MSRIFRRLGLNMRSRIGAANPRRGAAVSDDRASQPANDPMVESAFAASKRGDDEAALGLWGELIERRPDWSIGHAGRVAILRKMRRWEEADHALCKGLALFPDDLTLTLENGWLLLDTAKPEQALTLWRRIASRSPERPEGCVGLATALRQLARYDEADAALAPALEKFPGACWVFANHAVTADARGDRAEALRRWRVVLARFRDEPIGYAGVGAALKMLERFDEADAILSEGMERFADDVNIAVNHAHVPGRSKDWAEAARRWEALRVRWPQDPAIRSGFAETVMLARQSHDIDARFAANSSADDPPAGDERTDLRALMMRFESLGENCELGFVQRYFGAEPLGLLRWTGIAYEALIEALENQFAGIGEAKYSELMVNSVEREYYVFDRRYAMSTHTFISTSKAREDVLPKMLSRLEFLREKLLNALKDGDKIFVFSSASPLSDEQLRRLHSTLQNHGAVRLLHVAPSAERPPGQVAPVGANLWRGFVGRTGFIGGVWNVEFDAWSAICRAMGRLCPIGDKSRIPDRAGEASP